MKAGDLRGAFVVAAPMTATGQDRQSNTIALFLASLCTVLFAAGVLLFVVRKLVIRPWRIPRNLANRLRRRT